MSATGTKGFTLIEVLAASAILALGVVFIYQALLNCLDAYGYYESYFAVSSFMDEKIAQAQLELTASGDFSGETSGEFTNKNRKFTWELYRIAQGTEGELSQIELKVYWQSAKRPMSMSREAYALFNPKT